MTETLLNYSTVLRLALGLFTYLIIVLVQNVLNAAVFERYFENKVQRFTDVCTLSNISVWVRVYPRYGFYVHGRYADFEVTARSVVILG